MSNKNLKKELQQVPKETVQNDLNLEKWEVFTTTHYNKDSREIVRKLQDKEFRVIIGRIDNKEFGVLTAEDGKVFYALLKLWEEAGRPDTGPVNFALRQICKILGVQDDSRTYKLIKRHLDRLFGIPITFVESYRTKSGQDTVTVRINLVDYLELFERRPDKQQYFAFSKFKFNDHVIATIKNNYKKLLRLDVLKQLRSEIAFILYRHLELVMFDKNHYEVDLKTVAGLCGLSETAEVFTIKQRVAKALKELVGKDLTHGRIVRAEIRASQTGSGWKCIFEKGKQTVIEQPQVSESVADKKISRVLKYRGEGSDVKLAGSFNSWQAENMVRFVDEWSILLELEPGKYHYKFIVDGVWICDPENPNRATDSQGNENSVLVVQ